MATPYATYFDNPFLTLRMARPDFKAQASYTLRAVREARLGKAFEALLAELETALTGFDQDLTERQQPSQGATGAYRAARQAWLSFVDDTMKDYVTPRLRKLPVYADFKAFGKSRLSQLTQPELLLASQKLLDLYQQQAALGQPTLAADATTLLQALAAADATRDTQSASTSAAILGLDAGRAAIARAQRRLKAQLELTFDDPAKVYSFFDFSAANLPKAKKKALVVG